MRQTYIVVITTFMIVILLLGYIAGSSNAFFVNADTKSDGVNTQIRITFRD
jgi:hypothetical protein